MRVLLSRERGLPEHGLDPDPTNGRSSVNLARYGPDVNPFRVNWVLRQARFLGRRSSFWRKMTVNELAQQPQTCGTPSGGEEAPVQAATARALGVLAVAGVLTACGGPASPAGPKPQMVVLGDSYASGEGDGHYDPATGTITDRCHRSSAAAGLRAGTKLGFAVRSVACSGAVLADLTRQSPRSGEPTQLTALNAATRLVWISGGGNDVGFASLASSCFIPSRDCQAAASLARGRLPAVQSDLRRALTAVRSAAPHAVIVVEQYPALVGRADTPADVTRCGRRGVSANSDTLGAAESVQEALANATATTVQTLDTSDHQHGAPGLVVHGTPTFGEHGVCSADPWVGLPTFAAAVAHDRGILHPTAVGQQAMADALVADVRAGHVPGVTGVTSS